MVFKNKSNSRKMAIKISKSSILENTQICDGKSSPLFFEQKLNKKVSTKETFYQYLFIQSLLKNNEQKSIKNNGIISNELKDDIFEFKKLDDYSLLKSPLKFFLERNINKSFKNSLVHQHDRKLIGDHSDDFFIPDKKSQILEKLNIVSNQSFGASYPKEIEGIANYQRRNLKNRKGIHDQIFITYKKSFICYWLLPFLGLIGTSPVKTFHFGQIYSFPKNEPNLELNIFKNKENSLSKKNSYANMTLNDPGALPKLYDFSLFLSKNSSYKENHLLYVSNKTPDNNILKYKNSSESLLLTLLNLSTNKSSEKEFKKLNNLLNFKDFNLSSFTTKQKQISNFKWYWFDLFLHKTSNIFPNKVFNFSNNNHYVDFFSSGWVMEKPGKVINKEKLFISSDNNTKFQTFEKLKETIITLNLGFPEKTLENKSFTSNRTEFVLKNTNNYLVGIIKNSKKNNKPPITDQNLKEIYYDTKGPYNSLKKTNFLMDQFQLNESILIKIAPWVKTTQNFEKNKMNFGYPLIKKIKEGYPDMFGIDALKKEREKTILLIFKNNKNSLKNKINLALKKKNNNSRKK